MIRADFHCHTRYSHDCFAGIDDVLEWAARRELTHLAITDHDQIEGAFRARDRASNVAIIIGCEVTVDDGRHIIGLFLERKPAAKRAREVIEEIRSEGGFVLVPHPLQRESGLLAGNLNQELLTAVDALEVCNAHEPAARNEQVARLAADCRLAKLAGSDAHYGVDVGRACVEFPDAAGELTPAMLRSAARKIFGPPEDLSAIHARDAAFRARTLPRLRKLMPQPVRTFGKWVNWQRCRRQFARRAGNAARKEFNA
jgi:predicted metal-dependent phosphoesterase TrpH